MNHLPTLTCFYSFGESLFLVEETPSLFVGFEYRIYGFGVVRLNVLFAQQNVDVLGNG